MEVIRDEWFWVIVISVALIIIVPLIVIWSIFYLPSELKLVATISLIIIWGVVSGYKDWVISKRKSEEKKK